jgi:hypothetical protein
MPSLSRQYALARSMNPLADSVIQSEEREIACGLDPA